MPVVLHDGSAARCAAVRVVAPAQATAFEEEARVPLYIAGPGIPAGVVSPYQV